MTFQFRAETKTQLLELAAHQQATDGAYRSMTSVVEDLIDREYTYFRQTICQHDWVTDSAGHGDDVRELCYCKFCGKDKTA